MCHRQFFRVISQNRDYVDYFCDHSNNLFQFACQKWLNQLNLFLNIFYPIKSCFCINTPFQIRILGILIRILVRLRYNFTYLNTNNNIIFRIHVQKLYFFRKSIKFTSVSI